MVQCAGDSGSVSGPLMRQTTNLSWLPTSNQHAQVQCARAYKSPDVMEITRYVSLVLDTDRHISIASYVQLLYFNFMKNVFPLYRLFILTRLPRRVSSQCPVVCLFAYDKCAMIVIYLLWLPNDNDQNSKRRNSNSKANEFS